jgi:hypothetical protein
MDTGGTDHLSRGGGDKPAAEAATSFSSAMHTHEAPAAGSLLAVVLRY